MHSFKTSIRDLVDMQLYQAYSRSENMTIKSLQSTENKAIDTTESSKDSVLDLQLTATDKR